MAGRGFPNLPYAEMNDVVKININTTQEQREILSELAQRPCLSEARTLKARVKRREEKSQQRLLKNDALN